MPPLSFARRGLSFGALVLSVIATPAWAAEVYSGPNPALAPIQDRYANGPPTQPHLVYYDKGGAPYVFRGLQEKQFLAGYNVTWIDKSHVRLPQGIGGTD